MNWPEFMRRDKRFSSLELEKPDVTYEVWELGRTVAKILEACWLIRPPLREGRARSILIRKADDSFYRLNVLYKKLCLEGTNILGWIEELDQEIERFSAKDTLQRFEPEEVEARAEEIERLISCQLKAKSVHLFHIFSFSLSLRKLKTKLFYGLEIETEGIESHIKHTIDLVENLRLGDKILPSPNLEITRQNLKIIKFRLEGWLRFLPDLREYSKEIGSNREAKAKFLNSVQEKCDLWTELILDVKNPSDYLSFGRRFLNAAAPLFFCYYLIAIPVVLIPWDEASVDKNLFAILVPVFIPLLSLLSWLCMKIKDGLVERSFGFRLSEFKKNMEEKR